MAQINAYNFPPRAVTPYFHDGYGGLKDGKLTQMKYDADVWQEYEVLDNITLAAEAGLLDDEKFVAQLFTSKAGFQSFAEQLAEYDECYRITDQWWSALAKIAGVLDEEGFISSQEIADKLVEHAEETGQL